MRREACKREGLALLDSAAPPADVWANSTPTKFLLPFLLKLASWILKFTWQSKSTRIDKTSFKKNKVGGIHRFFFPNTFFKKTVIKTKECWQTCWSRAENPGINLYLSSFDAQEGCQDHSKEEKNICNAEYLGKCIATCKIMQLDLYFPCMHAKKLI